MRHTYQIRIPSFLCRPDDRIGYDGIASLFQEAAWEHAERFGVDFTETESDLYWVLHRLGIRFYRRPRWNDAVTITTWPSRMVRLSAMREFRVTDEEGSLLVDASSAWLVLNGTTRRPERPERLLSSEWTEEELPFELPLGKLSVLGAQQSQLREAQWHAVRLSDTDRNAHVNNARYIQWLSDWAPDTIGPDGYPAIFSFTAETRINHQFTILSDSSIAEVWVKTPEESVENAVCACRYNQMPLPGG